MLALAWSAGTIAFHLSQIGWNRSLPGGSSPASPASRNAPKISAWLPRWEATSAIVQPSSYDGA